jgi:hypothetical protein
MTCKSIIPVFFLIFSSAFLSVNGGQSKNRPCKQQDDSEATTPCDLGKYCCKVDKTTAYFECCDDCSRSKDEEYFCDKTRKTPEREKEKTVAVLVVITIVCVLLFAGLMVGLYFAIVCGLIATVVKQVQKLAKKEDSSFKHDDSKTQDSVGYDGFD